MSGHGLKKQIADARNSLARVARKTPFIFPEYLRLTDAEIALDKARLEYNVALKAWKQVLGGHQPKPSKGTVNGSQKI